jgi:hypothetical protein
MQRLVRWVRTYLSVIAVTLVLIPVTVTRDLPTIASDGVGYHLWTRAILEWDFSFCRYEELREEGFISRVDPERGVCQNQYPAGLALLRLPVTAFVAARGEGAHINGAEDRAVLILSGVALVAACLLCLSCCRRLGAPAWAAHTSVLTLVFGTGVFHYGTFDASFTHIYSTALFALLLLLGIGRDGRPAPRIPPAGVGVLSFFLISIRWTNVLLLGALLLARLHTAGRGQPARMLLPEVAAVGTGAAAAIGIQLAYNAYVTGTPFVSPYGGPGFLWGQPRMWSVLFSFERGLFTFYPALLVALLAPLAIRNLRRAGLALIVVVLAYATLYGFWWSWALGAGFGHRGFVELVPVAIVLFALALGRSRSPQRRIAVALGLVGAFATVELMVGYWRFSVPFAGTTRAIYWSHVVGEQSLLRSIRP